MAAVLQVTVQSDLRGYPVDNVFGLNGANEPSHTDANLLVSAVDAWLDTLFGPLSQELQAHTITLVSLTDPTIGASGSSISQGSVSGDLLPSFVCAKVQWKTGLRGRAYNGRSGLSGIPESYTDGLSPNVLKATQRSLIDTACNDFLAGLNSDTVVVGTGYTLAVVSQVLHGVPRDPAIATQIISASVPAELGTRRGRM